ncbi:MAG TPA: hypothetical protein VFV17_06735 [Usitatibacteraceae bacterium]|nr:hypothetical protein [Usitatibacteraceae bacterium]
MNASAWLAWFGLVGVAASAQTSAPPAKPCTGAEHRQFDFWIGDWDVFNPKGEPAGRNLIRPAMGGCVLHEQWAGKGGFSGESFNAWDASRGRWHQTWVDASGGVLLLDGVFANSSMTLSDRDVTGKKDANLVNEIAWTPNADGSVRQHWRVSKDGGKSWTTSFDGKYVRSARPQP